MFEVVLNRLAISSDVIFVMGIFIILLVVGVVKLYNSKATQQEVHDKLIVEVTLAHNKEITKLNDDILKALIDSTAAMVSVNNNYTELRSDLKDLNK